MNATRRRFLPAFVAACSAAVGLAGAARAGVMPNAMTDAEVLGTCGMKSSFTAPPSMP
jgi:hypothetical protein